MLVISLVQVVSALAGVIPEVISFGVHNYAYHANISHIRILTFYRYTIRIQVK